MSIKIKESPSSVQEEFLRKLLIQQVCVAIFLSNGIKLIGIIENFDEYTILLKSSATYANAVGYTEFHKKLGQKSADFTQMIFKNQISTIVPLDTLE